MSLTLKMLFASIAALLICACGLKQPLETGDPSPASGQSGATGGDNAAAGGSAGSASPPALVTLASGSITPFTIALDVTSVYWADYYYDASCSGTSVKV